MIWERIPYDKNNPANRTPAEQAFMNGLKWLKQHPLLGKLDARIYWKPEGMDKSKGVAVSNCKNEIRVNVSTYYNSEEWMHILAHCMMHVYFGHYDRDKMPDAETFNPRLWNKACDIFVERFLQDIKLGTPIAEDPSKKYPFRLNQEKAIYERLLQAGDEGDIQEYGTAGLHQMDMQGLNRPLVYEKGQENPYMLQFAKLLTELASQAVARSGCHAWDPEKDNDIYKASRWFISHYPLLGSVAASFHIVDDERECNKLEIQIAAVDVRKGVIYANPACGFLEMEWRFVLAHEFLHAGLEHGARCDGRNPFVWNLAVDFVVNGWLAEMEIGTMPENVLYDRKFQNMSAESVYDVLMADLRRSLRMQTFRGYHRGDLLDGNIRGFGGLEEGLSQDEFYKNALRQGLEYHMSYGRGTVPAGLIQEIRALMMPPVSWRVKLAEWFVEQFPIEERHRSYARPSRRQSATPDIPRPGYTDWNENKNNRTFGVIIDTSGSMSAVQIGKALGAAASYAAARDVKFVRVIFCDAEAYDVGYMAAEDIAGRVEVKGRGGTILQPAVDLLESAVDFPKAAPILLITDGMIEEKIYIHRDHAWILPKHRKLPFRTQKPVFQFD